MKLINLRSLPFRAFLQEEHASEIQQGIKSHTKNASHSIANEAKDITFVIEL